MIWFKILYFLYLLLKHTIVLKKNMDIKNSFNSETLFVNKTKIISFLSHFVCPFSATSQLAFSDLLQH